MKKIYYLLTFILVALSLLTVYKYFPAENNFVKNADEGYYFKYSKFVLEEGLTSYPQLFHNHVNIKENQIWPSPLRIGYYLLSSLWFRIFGSAYRSLALLSLACFLALLIISFFFAKKYFGRDFASPLLLLMAFSPLAMAMAKRALTDSMGNMLIGISLWLFLKFLLEKRPLNLLIFIVFFAYSILVREQYIIMLGFFVLSFLVYKYTFRNKISLSYLIWIIFAPLAIAGTAWLASSQNIGDLVLMLRLTHDLPIANPYAINFCRGPWYRYIVDYLLISPLTTILALSFMVFVLAARERLKDFKLFYFLLAICCFYILLSSFDFNKIVRYALCLDLMIKMSAIFMLGEIFSRSKGKENLVFCAVLVLCVFDYISFIYLFCEVGIYDPISFGLLKAQMFIP